MPNFWDVVNRVISEADILLEIVDARNIDETRNLEIEDKVTKAGKALIYVFNKCDLADQTALEEKKKELYPSVFVSSKEYHGIALLKERIMIEAKRLGVEKPRVGVLGYPNMGKSSVINALNGAGRARVSSDSGFTKGKQYINARGFVLIDTPGVIPYGEKDVIKQAFTGIKTDLKDPETCILKIMEAHPGLIEGKYNILVKDDKEETLEEIAIKLNLMKKGGAADTYRASQKLLRDLRDGKQD